MPNLDESDIDAIMNYKVPDIIYDDMQENFGNYFEEFLQQKFNMNMVEFAELIKDKFPEKFI